MTSLQVQQIGVYNGIRYLKWFIDTKTDHLGWQKSGSLTLGFIYRWTEGCKTIPSLYEKAVDNHSVHKVEGVLFWCPEWNPKTEQPSPKWASKAGHVAGSWHITCNSQTSPGLPWSPATAPVLINYKDTCILGQMDGENKNKVADTKTIYMYMLYNEVSANWLIKTCLRI